MSAREIHDEFVHFTLPNGHRGLALLPVIPEDAPYKIREGIARRRITATTGKCPCGATVDYDAALRGRYGVAEAEHDKLCPAVSEQLEKAVRRWCA